jgi:hypothetical protein
MASGRTFYSYINQDAEFDEGIYSISGARGVSLFCL